MKYLEFKDALKGFTVFSVTEINKIGNSHFHRRRLNEWQEKGYIRKVIKGYYIFADLELNENVLFEIANRIHQPSYISLEMALSYYHLIPESIYGLTSISSRRPGKYETSLANFIYRKVKPELFFGYQLIRNNGKWFKMATIEKAILDYFYMNPHLRVQKDFDNLRINAQLWNEQVDCDRLNSYLEQFSHKRLTKRVNSFLLYIKSA